MKKTILFLFLTLMVNNLVAQLNVQMHYDFGHMMYGDNISTRQKLTATIENFSADKWGSTYFFIDADFGDNVMRAAYTEFSREIQTKNMPVAIHVEYDGGLSYGTGNGDGYSYNDSYLAGLAYNWNSTDFSKGFSVQALYKYLSSYGSFCNSWQLTGVWRNTFANGLCTFCGFVDLWYDNTVAGNMILLSEPQFWFNLSSLKKVNDEFRLSIGTEWEISNNFVYNNVGQNNRFYVLPTFACKWTF